MKEFLAVAVGVFFGVIVFMTAINYALDQPTVFESWSTGQVTKIYMNDRFDTKIYQGDRDFEKVRHQVIDVKKKYDHVWDK